MKIKLNKKGKEYYSAIHTGNGGVSSMVASRQSKRLLFVLGIFKPKNLWVGIFGKENINPLEGNDKKDLK